jgi:hypothetical protein
MAGSLGGKTGQRDSVGALPDEVQLRRQLRYRVQQLGNEGGSAL